MVGRAACVGYDDWDAAGSCLRGRHAEGFGLAPVDKSIGTGDYAREGHAIPFGREEAHMRIAGNMLQDCPPLAPFAQHDEAHRGCMAGGIDGVDHHRSEEHTSELQSLMRISYAVFCLKK